MSGFPIGLFSPTEYEERILQLAPGDRIYLLTDGIIEAENEQGQQFGMDSLLRALGLTQELPLNEATKELMEQRRELVRGCRNEG